MINLKGDINFIFSNVDTPLDKFISSTNNIPGIILKKLMKDGIKFKNNKSPKESNLFSENEKKYNEEKKIKKYSSTLIPKSSKSKTNIFSQKEKEKEESQIKSKEFNRNKNKYQENKKLSNIYKTYINNNNITKENNKNNDNTNIYKTLFKSNGNRNSYVFIFKEKNSSRDKKNHSYSNNKNLKLSQSKSKSKDKDIENKKLLSNKNKSYLNNFNTRKSRNSNLNIPKQISCASNNSKSKISSFNNNIFINKIENQTSRINNQNSYSTFIDSNIRNSSKYKDIIKIRKKFNETCKYFYDFVKNENNNKLITKNSSKNHNTENINVTNSCWNIKSKDETFTINKFKNGLFINEEKINGSKKINHKKSEKITWIKSNSSKMDSKVIYIYNKENKFSTSKTISKYKKNKNLYNYKNKKMIKYNDSKSHKRKVRETGTEKSTLKKSKKHILGKNRSYSSRNIHKTNYFNNLYNNANANYFTIEDKTFSLFNTNKKFNNQNELFQSNIKKTLLNLISTLPESSQRKSHRVKNMQNNNKMKDIILNLNNNRKMDDNEKNNDHERQNKYYISLNNIFENQNQMRNLGKNSNNHGNLNNKLYCNKKELNNNEPLYKKSNANKKNELENLDLKIDKRKEDLMKIVYFSNKLYDNQKTN